MPALVFSSIATIDFSTVSWSLVASIALGKTAVLVVTAGVTLITLRQDPTRCAVAGIRAIVTTQSNDFAVGLPLLSALYPPEMTRYLYIAAPISFLWLNLIGFAMMGAGTRSALPSTTAGDEGGAGAAKRRRSPALDVLISVATNPVVFMTFLGLIANFGFKGAPPAVLLNPAMMVGSAFSATALLTLGMSMVGKVALLQGPNLFTASLLVFGKIILLPIVTRAVAESFALDEQSGIFLFLYSMIPSAPGALAFALHYNVVPSETAAAVVLCTIIAAPIMFISAKVSSSRSALLSTLSVVRFFSFS